MLSHLYKNQRQTLQFQCLKCNKNQENKLNEDLNDWFANTHKFCNTDINKPFLDASKKSVSAWIYGYLKSHRLKKRSFIVT